MQNQFIEINHYSKEFIGLNGEKVPFCGHVKPFTFPKIEDTSLPQKFFKDFFYFSPIKISLRLSSLAQIQELEKLILQNNRNPFYSLEFGEVVSTVDLYQKNITEILKEVFDFCQKFNMHFCYSTPKTLIERDFQRVYDDAKDFCLKYPPNSIIANNFKFFKSLLQDEKMKNFKIEAGYGLFLDEEFQNGKNLHLKNLSAIDFSPIKSMPAIERYIQETKDIEIWKKYTVSGSRRVQSIGICPLNDELPTVSRISCKAPCHKNSYAVEIGGSLYPFVVDGFCNAHLFESKIEILDKNYLKLKDVGISDFVIDMTALKADFLQPLTKKFIKNFYGC